MYKHIIIYKQQINIHMHINISNTHIYIYMYIYNINYISTCQPVQKSGILDQSGCDKVQLWLVMIFRRNRLSSHANLGKWGTCAANFLPWKACEMSLHPILESHVHSYPGFSTSKNQIRFPWTFLEPGPQATSSLPGPPGRRTTTRQRDPWTSEIFLALTAMNWEHPMTDPHGAARKMVLHGSHQQKPTLCKY